MDDRRARPARWLDDVEMRTWRSFIEAVGPVLADLDADLIAGHGISSGDYEVLVFLSEAPGHAMRMCDLADRLRLSPSGLTRRLDGLVRSGFVDRQPSVGDRRVTMAHLTPAGYHKLQSAAPDHVASVRRHLLDHLTRAELIAMGDAFVSIAAGRASFRDATP